MIFDNDITRRAFLGGTIKTTAILFCAPAIVRAESLMKIWIPTNQEIITDLSSLRPNFVMEGLRAGDQVFVRDEITGTVIINERVITGSRAWDIEPGSGAALNVAIRRNGFIDYINRVGSPYPGGQTKIAGFTFLTNRNLE